MMKRIKSSAKRSIAAAIALLFLGISPAIAGIFEGGDATKGEALFKANCASCHKISEEVLAAPGLQGLESRWKGKDALLVKWIQNPQAAAGTGDAYIKALVDKWVPKNAWMQNQAVTEAEIKDILAYVKAGPAAGGATTAATNKCLTLDEIKAAKNEGEDSDTAIWLIILGTIIAIIAVSAANISRSLRNAMREREGLEPIPAMSYWGMSKKWMWENKKFVSVIGFLLFCYFSVVGYNSLMDIGVYDGYTPDQPIWFSHAIHNCQNEIDCQYCHSSASKSKHAGIPSVNVCMNCHKGIKKGAISGEKEIAKIYAAIGFDPASGQYIEGYEQKPIVWNKVNNLPDHVYFNHSTHVAVGKVDCKNCHGPQNQYIGGHVPTAEEINGQDDLVGLVKLEKRPFTMGWCLECHNKKEVDLNSNAYYQEMHERYKASALGQRTIRDVMEDGKATVRELGGWECGKCHY